MNILAGAGVASLFAGATAAIATGHWWWAVAGVGGLVTAAALAGGRKSS